MLKTTNLLLQTLQHWSKTNRGKVNATLTQSQQVSVQHERCSAVLHDPQDTFSDEAVL